MQYKALITGNNNSVIDDFFANMHEMDSLTTSDRYGDVVKHIKYFAPDVFVYCIYKETKEDYSKIIPIKHLLGKNKIPLIVCGSEEDCVAFEQTAVNISDLTLQKPFDTDEIQKKIVDFIEEWKKIEVQEAEPTQGSAAPAGEALQSQIPTAQMVQPQVPTGQMMQPQVPTGQMVQPQAPTGQMMQPQAPTGQMAQPQAPTGQLMQPQAPAEQVAQAQNPAEKNAKKQETTRPVKRRRRLYGRGRILVIDDNPLMLKVIKEHLHEEYDVATAVNGKVAFRYLENRSVDLILLDYEMPDEDGPAVLEKLRAMESVKDVPVIFLTGISDKKKITKALIMKPEGYLLKPIDHDKLIATIKKYIF